MSRMMSRPCRRPGRGRRLPPPPQPPPPPPPPEDRPMTPPPRRKLLSPTEGPRPPRRPPHASPEPSEPESSWTEAKVRAVLEAYRSFVQNAARKHGVAPQEVAALV